MNKPCFAGWCIVLALLLAQAATAAAQTTQSQPAEKVRPAAWVPVELASRLDQPPKTDSDKAVLRAIADYQARLTRLKEGDLLVKAHQEHLRDLIIMLYREYNLPKARYTDDCFPVEECLKTLKGEMAFFLDDGIEKGKDPAAPPVGTWQARVCWIEGANIIGQYHLSIPADYDLKKSWPVAISYQNGPEKEQRKLFPYFFITSVQQGYPKGLTTVENKTRTFLKDAAREFNLDPLRFYATGFSYGGHTDITIAWRFPHWFAAITPLCSDLRARSDQPDDPTPTFSKYLKNVPALLLHGNGDSFLSTGKIVYQYMKDAGCDVTFETYPGGHDAAPIFHSNVKKLVDFWDKYKTDCYPKLVSHIVEHPRYARAFWVDAKLTKPGDGGPKATFEVRVKDDNKIEIDAGETIAELDFYLNDKLVDMAKPVTVVSGGKTVYEGKAQAKLTVKLRDGQDYPRGGGDALWEEVMAIRQAAARPPATQEAK